MGTVLDMKKQEMLSSWTEKRTSGVLLHPTSFLSKGPIGTLGEEARQFVDLLAKSRQRYWQMLPLGPTLEKGSPYSSPSAFAGNTILLDPEDLVREGWLNGLELDEQWQVTSKEVDFVRAADRANWMVSRAFAHFNSVIDSKTRNSFEQFYEKESVWLEEYALFIALKRKYGLRSWWEWPRDLAQREEAVISAAKRDLSIVMNEVALGQFLFNQQLNALKAHCRKRNISLIGDLPIYVFIDSVDVWAEQHLFLLHPDGTPEAVSGVPPDRFSATGQRWDNPLYRWDALEETGFTWWIERFKQALERFDLLRIDHFRGFQDYWSIPFSAETAASGCWRPGPGRALFDAVSKSLGPLDVFAEDLGIIDDRVVTLRDGLGFPGMKVLQFGFEGPLSSNPHHPQNHSRYSVVCPGTHDNDTAAGWYERSDNATKSAFESFLGKSSLRPALDCIEIAWNSPSMLAITPIQDLLELNSSARMNYPGTCSGNWSWRLDMDKGDLLVQAFEWLAELTENSGRMEPST
jgi:4-alpha-glucanotransferase